MHGPEVLLWSVRRLWIFFPLFLLYGFGDNYYVPTISSVKWRVVAVDLRFWMGFGS
jgi:hypothetical protein